MITTGKLFLTYLELARLRNCLLAMLGVGIGGSLVLESPEGIFWACVSAFLITAAGNSLNDYFDFEIDRINRPNRPIPSGRISRSDAAMFSVLLFLLGLLVAKGINQPCFLLAAINSCLLVFYAKYSKRLHLISNLLIAYLVASLFLYGILASKGTFFGLWEEEQVVASVLMACAFLMTASREVLKDIEDLEGDASSNAKTLPIVVGIGTSRLIAALFAGVAMLLALSLPFLIPGRAFDVGFYFLIIIVSNLIFLTALILRPAEGQRLMLIGMSVALVAFLGGSVLPKL